uniref:exocyst complex component EXO70H1-like n=1 Tax=Erigeron canadensis TaxID=72917 RepID=UPI001CB9AE12|nr:exocyst complex component EXO70H1-like [Erigeron canadensis]
MAIISSPSPKRLTNQKPKKLIHLFSFNTISSTTSSPNSQTASSSSSLSSPFSSSSSESMMDETIKDAHTVIHKWDHSNTTARSVSMFQENKTEAELFIKCAKGLHRLMHFLAGHDSQSEKLFDAQKLMQIAMKRLEKDFHLILSNNNSTNSDQHLIFDIEQLSTLAISNLRLIADTMISCGYRQECIQVYKNIRKLIIDESLFQLGIQQYSSSQINKMLHNNASHNLDDHVKTWVNATQIAMRKLFCNEKLLSEHIFTSYVNIQNSCFEMSTKEGAMNLFKFPELIATTRCNKKLKSETVFIMLDLHNSILELWPEIESLFSTESVAVVKVQAIESLHKLSDSIRTVLDEFKSSVHKNSCKIRVSGGGVDPLSISVLDYLTSLTNYGDSLSNVIVDEHEQTSFEEASRASVSIMFGSILSVLLCKLDGKAKLQNCKALQYLFLINNLNSIIEKVRSTNMRFILGEEWIGIHEKKLDAYVLSYETMTWYKVIACLPNSCIYVSGEKAKACFRKLYFMFEEVYVKQMTWTVVDEFMRDKMKVSIVKNLVPVYEEFYAKHLITLSTDELCVKLMLRLSPENMMKYLLELFHETTVGFRSD